MRVRVIASRLYAVQILERFVVVCFVVVVVVVIVSVFVLLCFLCFFLWAEVIYSFHYLPTLSFLDFFQILERFVLFCFVFLMG